MNIKKFVLLGLTGLCIAGRPAAGEQATVQYTLDADALEARGQFKQLKFFGSGHAIRLDDMYLIEDDAPAIGMPEGAKDRSWFERLHRGVTIRKDLVLDDPRAYSGWLVFNGLEMKGNETPLHIGINGVQFIRPATKYAHPFARQYYTRDWAGDLDNWFFVEIPVGALRKGVNEITIHADSDSTSWEIMVAADGEYKRGSDTRTHHPNRSAKSRDGGQTWDFDHLGWKGEIDGEYDIRLSLDRSVPEGIYTSPVIDLAEAPGAGKIKKLLRIGDCRVQWDIDVPEGSSADISVRTGDNPVPSSNGWSVWEETGDFTRSWQNTRGRYLQFRVVMKAVNPLVTPALRGMTVTTTTEDIPIRTNITKRIVEFRNGMVIRSSVEYTHEDFAKLREYRERFQLDKVVAGATSEFEAQLRLMRWAYEIPIKGLDRLAWNYYDLPDLKKDAKGNIVLQKEYTGRRRDAHCLYCNLTLIGACLAMGYPARWINIATRTTYGHEVTEVWSNEFNKWVFLDATRDYYIYDPDTGIPMNLVEINGRLREIAPRPMEWEYPIRWAMPGDSLAYNARIKFREGDNKFSIYDVSQGPHLLFFKGQLHMPLRNDFASRQWPVPWRISSNWGGDLFYGFYNDTFPRKREYQLHTDRPQDFNYPLNQAELTVSETELPAVLRIDADTVTPCFDTFLVNVDGGGWKENRSSAFAWKLHEGLNRLRMKVRNTAGVTGPESFVSVVMNN
ncbi:transglutaminase-like domain-containing protein [bacterium]|nr:transglutaminase-like domain-containing protein [bacterium]